MALKKNRFECRYCGVCKDDYSKLKPWVGCSSDAPPALVLCANRTTRRTHQLCLQLQAPAAVDNPDGDAPFLCCT